MTAASAPELDPVAAAYRVFESLRWPGGEPTCPYCGLTGRCRFLPSTCPGGRRTRTGQVSSRRVWLCGACRRQFSVLSGTVFERTRVPLPVWLAALRTVEDGCASAAAIRSVTGVEHETAHAMAALITSGLAGGLGGCGAQPQG